MIQRTILADEPRHAEEIAPGVRWERLHPGGKDGPKGEVLRDVPGGLGWSDFVLLGRPEDEFQTSVPDIRLPANQYWPLHWHGCAIAVVILEGSCIVGDYVMQPGEVMISDADLEYGPLVVGPKGCRLFEIFARHHIAGSGYALEYRDHPTLQGLDFFFEERSELNKRNEGRQILPVAGVDGLTIGRVANGAQWDLGDPNDPERTVMRSVEVGQGQVRAAHSYGDWHAIIVLDGELQAGGRRLVRDDLLLAEPDAEVPELVAGPSGVTFLELARTASGIDPRYTS